ncbi:MAG: hypothetical protein WCC38_07885 [Pseudonocardiaceae bacterium]
MLTVGIAGCGLRSGPALDAGAVGMCGLVADVLAADAAGALVVDPPGEVVVEPVLGLGAVPALGTGGCAAGAALALGAAG